MAADGSSIYGGDDPDNRIAIVGRAGRFPDAPDVAAFWRMLAEGRHAMRRLSEAELLAAGVSRKALADPNYVRTACVLPEMECFDAGFFGFSPKEAAILDPQHRHFLEVGWEALEDAGHVPDRFEGRIGVYAGSGMQAYLPYNILTNPDLVDEIGMFLLRHTGNDKDFLPTRLSYLLNLTGPSVAVQTACSTSLVAVHTAMGALLNMECDMALAGGVTIELPHGRGYRYAEGEILSPDGLCRAFDDEAKGTVFGSGAAVLVLRRYGDAVADGDDIKAVLLASAVNNDGSGKASYLAPSVDGQAEAAAEALALAGLEAGDVSYIEAHGTGTPIGDPIELEALGQVYGEARTGSIGIGSVKTNIGHLDTAAGAASLIKVVEAMRHRRLPASLNFSKPNSRFDFARAPFRVQGEAAEWNAEGPLRAAVNSLGVGGTNAHVIVEEAPERGVSPGDGAWQVCLFSARDKAALSRSVPKWTRFLSETPPAMADIAATLRDGRRPFGQRLAVAARTPGELSQALSARASAYRAGGTATEGGPSIVFLYPGGGAQYPGAGAGMLAQSDVFARAVGDCFAALPAEAPEDLREVMFERTLGDSDAVAKMARSAYAIPALFILEYAYTKLWESWGVRPDAILAHSVGEYAGAVAAGAMGLGDALRIVVLRGQVMDAAPEGAMTAVQLGEEAVRAELGATLDIAAVNGPEATVVSGTVAEVEAFERRLADKGHEPQRIRIDVAAHSRQLETALDRFRAGFDGVSFGKVGVPMASSLRGDWVAGDDMVSADYWVRHLRHTVRFADAVSAVLDRADRVVIEVGPGQTLGPLVEAAGAPFAPQAVLASAPRPKDGVDEMGVALAALGGLWAAGAEIDWTKTGAPQGHRVSVPTYAFAKDRHWIEPGRGARAEAGDDTPVLARRGDVADWFETTRWAEAPAAEAVPEGRWLVFAGDDAASGAVLARLRDAGVDLTVVRAGGDFAAEGAEVVLRPEAEEDYARLGEHLGELPERILSLWPMGEADPFGPAYRLAQMIQSVHGGGEVRLTFAVPDRGGDVPGLAPGAASLLGLVRSAPREVPGLRCALVAVSGEAGLAGLAGEAAGALDDDLVSLGRAARMRQERVPARAAAPVDLPRRLKQGGTYLITGGAGGIGRELALWLARVAGARVGLLSRSAEPDAAFEAAVRAAGGAARMLAADVTDEAAVRAAAERLRTEFGEIAGVIHAAGVIDDAPLGAKDLTRAREVMAPKLDGGAVLDRVFPAGSVELFAVVSSTSVALGPAGQADYVGANAALEALASARPDGLAIAWGVWRDIGMAARAYGAGERGEGLLTAPERAADGALRFDRVLDPEADWELAEHGVGGQPVLPGTAILELGLSAARAVFGGDPVALASVSFAVPMLFPEGLPRRVSVVLTPRGEGYDLRVESRGAEGEAPVEHVSAVASRARGDEAAEVPASLRGRDEGGQAVQAGAVAFGPRWDTRGAVETEGDVARAVVRLDAGFAGDLAVHPAHPALFDVAATVGLHLLGAAERQGLVYAPLSVEAVRQHGPLAREVYARAVRTGGEARSHARFDVTLHGMDGRCLLALDGLTLRAVEGGVLPEGAAPGLARRLLATGIRRSEAAEVFARVFDHEGAGVVVSPVDLGALRLAMVEAPAARAVKARTTGSGSALSSPVAAKLAAIWEELLGVEAPGEADDFFAIGGHSLAAVRMFAQVRKVFGVALPLATLFEAPTLGALAARIAAETGADGDETAAPPVWSPLVRIGQGEEGRTPFFMVHGAGGNVLNFRPLAGFLHPSIPFYGLRALGSDGGTDVDGTIEAMAERYMAEILKVQPEGPYRLGGYSGGGIVAFEIAQRLRQRGHATEQLVMFDTLAAHVPGLKLSLAQKLWVARKWDFNYALDWLRRRRLSKESRTAEAEIARRLAEGAPIPDDLVGRRMTKAFLEAQKRYEAAPYDGPVTILTARKASTMFLAAGPMLGWDGLLTGEVEVRGFDCDHFSMMAEPAIAEIGKALNGVLGDASAARS